MDEIVTSQKSNRSGMLQGCPAFILLSLSIIGCQVTAPKTFLPSVTPPVPPVTPTEPPAVVNFLNRKGLNFPIGVESTATNSGVSLYPLGISALNHNVAFLYGLSDVGSILLRTRDGGKRWQEVMPSDPESRVVYVAFANESNGWALVERYWGEAGGPITLFQTIDGGLTWKELTVLPLNSRYWSLTNVQFFNPEKGQIDIYNYDAELSGNCDKCLLTYKTIDGGRTWTETKRLLFRNADEGKAYLQSHTPIKFDRSMGTDRSGWYFHENREAILVRRSQIGQNLATVGFIPKHWDYSQGQIVPKTRASKPSPNL
jgi:hypothetical protein